MDADNLGGFNTAAGGGDGGELNHLHSENVLTWF